MKIGQNFQAKQAEIEREEREQREVRGYKAAGYRESEAHKPDIDVGGKGLMAPKTVIDYKDFGNGNIVPIISQQRYGEQETIPQKLGSAIKGPSLQKKTNYFIGRDEKTYGQDYNYNPSTGKLEPLGKPYLSKAPGSTTVNIHNNPTQVLQKKAAEYIGKGLGESINKRYSAGEEARNQNYQLGMVKVALSEGARTGLGEESLLNLRSFGQTLGIGDADLSGQELIRKISNEMALRLRNPESGLGLTGNTSNKDLQFLKDSVVGLARTERGNLKIIDSMEKMNNLKIAIAKEQNRILMKNKGIPPIDLNDKLMKFVDNYKFFTPKERMMLKNLSKPIKRIRTHKNGRQVIEFEDGTFEYASDN